MTDRPTVAADSPVARANAQVVLEFLSVVLGADHGTDQLARFLSPAFIDHDPAGTASGGAGVAAKLDALWAAIPTGRYVPDAVVAAGELVVVRSRLIAPGASTGSSAEVAFADTYRVVGGRIAEHWHVVDTAALGSLLG